MDLKDLIPVGTAIGGALATILGFRLKSKDANRADFQSLLDRYDKALKDSEARIESLAVKIHQLEEKIDELTKSRDYFKNQLVLLQAAHYDDPLPRWTKDKQGRMIHVNRAYEEAFLKPIGKTADDYIGKLDKDVWGASTAEEFRKNDLYVQRTGKVWIGFEHYDMGGKNLFHKFYFIKNPYYVRGTKTILGTEGKAIPLPEELERVICEIRQDE